LIIFPAIKHFENKILKEHYDEVHIYFNVLVALMLNWFFGYLNGTVTITPECGWMQLLEIKL
jgi:hypothetical protein